MIYSWDLAMKRMVTGCAEHGLREPARAMIEPDSPRQPRVRAYFSALLNGAFATLGVPIGSC